MEWFWWVLSQVTPDFKALEMKRDNQNSTFSCWKEVQADNCRMNSSLIMSFGSLIDTHFQATLSKKEADGMGLNIMKCPLLHIHHLFPSEWRKHGFLTYYSKKYYIGINRCGKKIKETKQIKNKTLHKLTR